MSQHRHVGRMTDREETGVTLWNCYERAAFLRTSLCHARLVCLCPRRSLAFSSSFSIPLHHSLSTLEQWGPCQRCLPSCFAATCSLGFRIQTPALSPASQSYRRITADTETPQSKSETSGVGFNSEATKKARYQLNRIIGCLINVLVANEIFAGGWRGRPSVWNECHIKKRRTEKTFNAPKHKNKTICRCWSGLLGQL